MICFFTLMRLANKVDLITHLLLYSSAHGGPCVFRLSCAFGPLLLPPLPPLPPHCACCLSLACARLPTRPDGLLGLN